MHISGKRPKSFPPLVFLRRFREWLHSGSWRSRGGERDAKVSRTRRKDMADTEIKQILFNLFSSSKFFFCSKSIINKTLVVYLY